MHIMKMEGYFVNCCFLPIFRDSELFINTKNETKQVGKRI